MIMGTYISKQEQKGEIVELSCLIEKLNSDLKNEWKHLKFYLHHASRITGLHCEEYKEFLLKSAASEMEHVTAFSDLITGLGGIPTKESNEFPSLEAPEEILSYAANMEEEVFENYHIRMNEAEDLNNSDGRWIIIFLEDQMKDSRQDLDHLKQILKNI